MEDFEKIKEITLEEAEKILPEQIAYLTMKDGEVIIVNGLDHIKFDKREKEYEDWIEEQSKSKFGINNFEPKLMRILEDKEENERSSNLMNKEQNLYKRNIYNNINNRNNINIKNDQEQIPQRRINTFNKNNYNNYENLENPNSIPNLNNNNYSLYNNNIKDQRNNYNELPLENNYRNEQMMNMSGEYYDTREMQNQKYFRYRPNPNNSYFGDKKIKTYTPLSRGGNNLIRDNFHKKGIIRYIRYNNHSYVEIK